MSVVLRIYENAEKTEYNDHTFESTEVALSKLNAYGNEPFETCLYWAHGFTIYNSAGEPEMDILYPLE